jgi:hypothetical protein
MTDTPEKIWKQALSELELQMTKATFNTWLKDAQFTSLDKGVLTISVRNEYAKDWLENRLAETIARVYSVICGQEVALQVQITPPTSPAPAVNGNGHHQEPSKYRDFVVEVVNFDPVSRTGFLMLGHYHNLFWRPYLEAIAKNLKVKYPRPFDLWLVLISWQHIKKTSRLDIDELCQIYGGTRDQLLGRVRGDQRQYGDMDILELEGIVKHKRTGTTKNTEHTIKVLGEHLPLLTPAQVNLLPRGLRLAHSAILQSAKVSLADWKQITIDSLVDN